MPLDCFNILFQLQNLPFYKHRDVIGCEGKWVGTTKPLSTYQFHLIPLSFLYAVVDSTPYFFEPSCPIVLAPTFLILLKFSTIFHLRHKIHPSGIQHFFSYRQQKITVCKQKKLQYPPHFLVARLFYSFPCLTSESRILQNHI
jgi:hypothetical protein